MTNITDEKKELDRLTKLADYDIDYSKDFEELDDLSKLAAHISGTPISLINLIGANTQWSISEYGMDQEQMPRKDSICDYTINETDYLELSDLDKSEEFKDKPYVTGDPNLRYYFGVPLRTKDGVKIGAVCVMDQENHSFSPEKIEMFKIIADEVMSRLEHRKLVKDLKESLEEANDVTRKVSHDIRGPIGGIIGLSQIIKENAENQDLSDIIELIEMINKGGKTILELADEILSTHRKSDEPNNFKRESFTLSTLKEKLLDLYNPQAQLKDIEFKINVSLENRGLSFPKNKLLQIFGNMISNALKFTEKEGSVIVNLECNSIDETHANLLFSVADDGVGMTEDQIDIMYNHQATSTPGTDNERGFGFGFQLSKHLVKTLNGTLDIQSETGKGTTISIKLPVKVYAPDS
jgi:signal transduction histidine kinase